MKVLVACEFSCIVRDAFLERGHDAWSCDLLACWGDSDRHYRQDVRPLLKRKWDLVIAHPPCTYLTNAANQILWTEPGRFEKMLKACEFFNFCLSANSKRICVENPVQHGEARKRIIRWTQTIQPWQFGEAATKRTCLWLKGLPELQPTRIVEPPPRFEDGKRSLKNHDNGNKHPRGKYVLRSVTFKGIAQAMVDQWGGN